jgi:hypothetical protein
MHTNNKSCWNSFPLKLGAADYSLRNLKVSESASDRRDRSTSPLDPPRRWNWDAPYRVKRSLRTATGLETVLAGHRHPLVGL